MRARVHAPDPQGGQLAEDTCLKRRLRRQTPTEKAVGPQGERAGLLYSYRLLGYRGRSEKEMAGRLRIKGFEAPVIENVISSLKASGLLDDNKLAFSLTRYAVESRKLSATGTRRFLMQRGIPGELIHDVLADLDETETARRLVEKRLAAWEKRGLSGQPLHLTPEMIKKLYAILYRNRFLPEVIKKTLQQITRKEDME